MIRIRSNSFGAIMRRRAGFISAITLLAAGASATTLSTLPKIYTAKSQIILGHADNQTLHTHIEALRSLNKRLQVTPAGRAAILNLSYAHKTPQKAAHILNTLTERYITHLTINPYHTTNPKTQEFLTTLKANIDKASAELKTFEAKALKHARAPSIASHEAYEAAKITLHKTQIELTPFLQKDGNFTLNPNAPALRASKALQNLRAKQRELVQQRANLGTRYGPKHPEMKQIASALTVIEQQITEESTAILETLKTNFALAKTHIKTLEEQGMRAALKEEAARFKQSQEKLSLLKKRLSEAKNLYTTFANVNAKAINASGQAASILTPAGIPTRPSFPKIPALSALAAGIAFILAALIAYLDERKSSTFISARQIEETLDLPCFGLIPKAEPDKKKPIANFVLDNPSDPTSEAIRALKLNIKLRAESLEAECKVISLTSTLAGEGKTTLACWLARLSAKTGQRVILIDADLRRPSIHLAMGKRSKTALADYLSGTKKLEDTIDTSDKSGLHVIYGRPTPSSALDMISSEKMDALLRNLRSAYDLIIIDTPASMAVPDARALEKRSDLFLYCIAWNKTQRNLIHSGTQQFLKFSKPAIATVLTQLDPKKHVQYGYGITENKYEDYNAS